MEGDVRAHSTLRIGNVTESDQGKIWCVAQYDEGMHDSEKAELTVVGKCSVCDIFIVLELPIFCVVHFLLGCRKVGKLLIIIMTWSDNKGVTTIFVSLM